MASSLLPDLPDSFSSASSEVCSELLRSILKDTSDAIVITTAGGEAIVYVNPAFEKITGYSFNEAVGRNPDFLRGPETHSQAVLRIKEAVSQGHPAEGEILNYRKDGTPFWFAFQIFPVLNDRGETSLLASIQRDITAERRRTEALERRRDELRAMLDGIPLGMIVTVDSMISHANTAFLQMSGRTWEEIRGQRITDILVAGDDGRPMIGPQHLFGEEDFEPTEYRLGHPDGADTWVELSSASVSLPRGAGYVYAVSDVTERRRARKEIEWIRDRLEESQRIAQVGNWEWDISNGDIWWSREVYRMFGVVQEEFSPSWEQFLARIPPADQERVINAVDAALQGAAYDLRHRVVVDGQERTVHERGEVHLEEGRATRMTGTVQDVTEAVETEQALRRSRQALRSLAQGIQNAQEAELRRVAREVHDEFGQHLTAARFDTVWLSRNLPEDPPELRRRSERLQETVEHLLDCTRSLTQRLWPTVLDDLGLEAAIEWQVHLLSERTALVYDVQCTTEALPLTAEAELAIFRIVQEALTNAVRHAEASHVQVTLDQSGAYVVAGVEDNGLGISESALSSTGSIGLVGMAERARAVGGCLVVEPLVEGGTRVIARIPIGESA